MFYHIVLLFCVLCVMFLHVIAVKYSGPLIFLAPTYILPPHSIASFAIVNSYTECTEATSLIVQNNITPHFIRHVFKWEGCHRIMRFKKRKIPTLVWTVVTHLWYNNIRKRRKEVII